MKLLLPRQPSSNKATISQIFHNMTPLCYVLEDVIREIPGEPVGNWKIQGKSAIPAGTYKIEYTFSERFQKKTLQLMNVVGFSGIRIHSGNTDADTEGCLLLGTEILNDDFITNSKLALTKFESYVLPHLEEGIWIEIQNPKNK